MGAAFLTFRQIHLFGNPRQTGARGAPMSRVTLSAPRLRIASGFSHFFNLFRR